MGVREREGEGRGGLRERERREVTLFSQDVT